MKKTILFLVAAFLLSLIPMQVNAGSDPKQTAPTATVKVKAVDSKDTKAMRARLDEIKKMDKSKLTASEKTQLRNEVRAMQDGGIQTTSSGVYLSVGAIIVILLILILLV